MVGVDVVIFGLFPLLQAEEDKVFELLGDEVTPSKSPRLNFNGAFSWISGSSGTMFGVSQFLEDDSNDGFEGTLLHGI
uniref:Peptidase A1 domain-containing protein n=1 Tax=Strongyloides papillosus TaxID=174720 RepID=A0A0N5BG77_STREA